MESYIYDNFWTTDLGYEIFTTRLNQITVGGRHKRSVKMDLYYDEKQELYIYSYKLNLSVLQYKKIASNITVQYLYNKEKKICAIYSNASNRKRMVEFKIMNIS